MVDAKGTWKDRNNVDRISLLPDSLIHYILSFLNAQQVVQTCVLSKRWKTIWTHTPTIKFDFDSYQCHRSIILCQSKEASFRHFMLGVLSQHCGTNIQTLSYSLSEEDYEDRLSIEFLVSYARFHKVQQLLLDVPKISSFTGWKFCFSGFKSLTMLKMSCGFIDQWGSLMLPSLRILEIESSGREDQTIMGLLFNEKMFSGCPNLESLVLDCYFSKSFGICAPKLKNLKLRCPFGVRIYFLELQLSTPNLKSVKFSNVLAVVKSASHFPYLDTVTLELLEGMRVSRLDKPKLPEHVLKFLQAFRSARSLTFPLDTFKVLLSYRTLDGYLLFHNLKNLTLKTRDTNNMIDLPVRLFPCFPFLNRLLVDLHQE